MQSKKKMKVKILKNKRYGIQKNSAISTKNPQRIAQLSLLEISNQYIDNFSQVPISPQLRRKYISSKMSHKQQIKIGKNCTKINKQVNTPLNLSCSLRTPRQRINSSNKKISEKQIQAKLQKNKSKTIDINERNSPKINFTNFILFGERQHKNKVIMSNTEKHQKMNNQFLKYRMMLKKFYQKSRLKSDISNKNTYNFDLPEQNYTYTYNFFQQKPKINKIMTEQIFSIQKITNIPNHKSSVYPS